MTDHSQEPKEASAMGYERIYLAVVVLILVLLLLCYRRRRRRKGVVVVEETVEKDVASSTSTSALGAHPLTMHRHNSVLKLLKSSNVHDIMDKLENLEDVSAVIRRAGLESCNLIFGIDYTGSNYLQGKKTFGGKCLHHIDPQQLNPYQKVICILGETLESFADDHSIPAYGFGDTFTRDHSVFSINTMGPCKGFQDVMRAYNEMTPKVRLGGPTNFAPLINQAIQIVKKKRSYHMLVIVADGQVTAERDTTQAIVEASNWPLSIIMVGVGDGPWDMMEDFDDKIPARRFDNFKFVNFISVTEGARNPQSAFAMHATMEIPDQFKAMKQLGLLDFSD